MDDSRSTTIYLSQNKILLIGDQLENSTHSHHALQINIALDRYPETVRHCEGDLVGHLTIIAPDYAHQIVQTQHRRALILLNSESAEAQTIRHYHLHDEKIIRIDNQFSYACRQLLQPLLRSQASYEQAAEIIKKTLRLLSPPFLPAPNIDVRVQKIFALVDNEDRNILAIDDLASSVGLSRSRLSHVFREHTGLSLKRYLLWHKVYRAGIMIGAGLTITDASAITGFADTSHFTRAFKQMFGMTPSQVLQPSDNIKIVADKRISQQLLKLYTPSKRGLSLIHI